MELEPGTGTAAAPITRGAATIYNGKLFRVTIDNHVLALDMKTGKQVWNQKFADSREGYYATSAPIVANGVLISGMAGGESTTRGFLDGWDPDTGKKLWRRYTIPAPGEPGSETWPKNSDAWMHGGGPTWRSGSYDPQLDLVYWGTGNAEPYDPRPRAGLDSLFTSSVLAIRPKTGEIVCHFQYTPNDVYDVDGTDEHVLADIQVGGQLRQGDDPGEQERLPVRAGSHQLQADCGQPLRQGQLGHAHRSRHRAAGGDRRLQALSGRRRGRNLAVARHQRRADRLQSEHRAGLCDARGTCRGFRSWRRRNPQVIGASSTGVVSRLPQTKPGDVLGHFAAINPFTGEKKWEVPLTDFPSSAGMLATGGGLVFTGKLTGEFVALDEATGSTLWQFKTGSSINSTAITYTHKGRQYVTIASGLGGGLANRYAATRCRPAARCGRSRCCPNSRYSTGYGPSENASAWYPFDPTARASGLRVSSPAWTRSIM